MGTVTPLEVCIKCMQPRTYIDPSEEVEENNISMHTTRCSTQELRPQASGKNINVNL
jgi:hypothetical protein